jgi:hypothetical protein
MRKSTLLFLALACVVQPLTAQFARTDRAGLHQPSAGLEQRVPQFAMPRDGNESYWKEGGAVTALAAIIMVNSLPLREGRDTILHRLLGSAGAAAIFFWPGALIGKQFPKD